MKISKLEIVIVVSFLAVLIVMAFSYDRKAHAPTLDVGDSAVQDNAR